MPASLLNTAIALPEHVHSQEDMRGYVAHWLRDRPMQAAKADDIMQNAEVSTRYSVRPSDWYWDHQSVTERSQVYREEMIRLCERAAEEALAGAGVHPEEVGLIISTSCTGLMIPAVESYLINRMGFRPTTRRQPLTALGCAAGAAAVGQAATYLTANPAEAVLILTAELASLTGQVDDFNMSNIVSVSLFGDGVAAAVVAGEQFRPRRDGATGGDVESLGAPAHRPAKILASRSFLFPDTENLMGFDNTDTGLRIFLLPRVPRFLRNQLPRQLPPFLEENGLKMRDLSHFLLHPGGPKVLQGLEEQLPLTPEKTRLSWKVLRDYGNLSSASVMFLLYHFEREEAPKPGETGLMLAVGPGFAAEMVLLQW